jgi:RNA polymerase sigma-70 factor (ECF subfamily)
VTGRRSPLTGWLLPEREGSSAANGGTVENGTKTTFVDETAFRAFYNRTAPKLRSYLRVLARDSILADDLLQESFLRFLRAGVSGLNEFQMKTYLYKTATSVMNDYWRTLQRERRHIAEGIPAMEFPGSPELSHDMNRLFSTLDPRQQSLLWLAYVEGFRHSEIADLLGLKEQSIKVMLLRARRQLADRLTAEGLGPEEK